jgi:hypothetical protein
MVFDRQALSECGYVGAHTGWKAFYGQHQQILLRLNAGLGNCFLAEPEKP